MAEPTAAKLTTPRRRHRNPRAIESAGMAAKTKASSARKETLWVRPQSCAGPTRRLPTIHELPALRQRTSPPISQDCIEIERPARIGVGGGTVVSGPRMSKPQVVDAICSGIK